MSLICLHRSLTVPLAFSLCLALAPLTAALSGAADAGFTVTGISTTTAAPGDPLTISGTGFGANADDHLAVLYDSGSGASALIDIASATEASLEGAIVATSTPLAGIVTVVKGTRFDLPDLLAPGSDPTLAAQAYLVQNASWFAAADTAEGDDTLTVSGSSDVESSGPSTSLPSIIHVDELWCPTYRPCPGIKLDILVEGGKDTSGTGAGSGSGGGGERTKHHASLDVRWAMMPMPVDPPTLARDLAALLRATFGALGLEATAVGSELHIGMAADHASDTDGGLRNGVVFLRPLSAQ